MLYAPHFTDYSYLELIIVLVNRPGSAEILLFYPYCITEDP